MYDSAKIANRLLALAEADGNTLTSMQLLKLVYIAHGWHLGLYNRPLICDEVQAWQYGPVIPRLYNRLRHFRASPVTAPLRADDAEGLDPKAESIVNQVYKIYGKMTGPALSRMTHAKGTPWELLYQDGSFGIVIPNDIIEDHYTRLAKKAS
mgnify:CR=1 FL=1